MNVIEICAGAGGFTLGWKRAGCTTFGVELDPKAAATHNAGVGPCIVANVENYSAEGEKADIAAGGVPCPPFSDQGLKLAFDDPRGLLFRHLLRVSDEANTGACVMENVKGMTHRRKGEPAAVDLVVDEFRKHGLFASWSVLNAADFGVPQYRERAFIVGFRSEAAFKRFRWPKPTHGPWARRPHVTLREALNLGSADYATGRRPGIGWWQGSRFLDPDKPGPTLGTKRNYESLWLAGDPPTRVKLTLQQLAIISGFPADFPFQGGSSDVIRQMGNAVPPLLGQAVARSVLDALATR